MNPRAKLLIKQRTNYIEKLIHADPAPIRDIAIWETKEHVSAEHAARQKFEPCAPGRVWGGPWQSAWFRFRFALPKALAGRNAVARIAVGGEGVAFIGGEPFIGLNKYRDEVPLPQDARAGRRFEVLVEAGANDDFGKLHDLPKIARAELAAVREQVRQLWYDLRFLRELMERLDEASSRAAELLVGLEHAVESFRFDAADLDAEAARVRRMLRPLYARRANASSAEVALSGHAHIDVAWLWPLAESTRKCARTFAGALTYMDRYPEYRFSQTQAYLYEATKKAYPGLYRRIRDAVRRGRWEVDTAMYVEADQNIPSGESLVRQLLFGKRFARDEFGVDVDVLVLPDVFGYNAQLPQLLRKAGVRYFTTQKISWNDTNRFPYNSFVWEGLDGSEVLAHFLPGESYNSDCSPTHLIATEKRHAERGLSKPILYQYGYGDGGGGPTPMMIEFGRRARNTEGLPRCRFDFVRDFFHRLERDAAGLPRWVGEFYFELHRGTYTTQALTKLLNRRCELALREAELFGALDLAHGGRYEARRLNEAWRLVLLNQFHDVLPGSSIHAVYELADRQKAEALSEATLLAQRSAAHLGGRIDTRGPGVPVIVWNSLSWPRSGAVQVLLPEGMRTAGVVDSSGRAVPCQALGGGELLFRAADVPPMGYAVHRLVAGGGRAARGELKVTATTIENRFLRARLNGNGEIVSLYDKANRREVIRGGRGNELQLFNDYPAGWDAWDVEPTAPEERIHLPDAESVRVVERGPVRAAVEVRRRFSGSRLVQRIVLHAGEPRLDFETEVDWDESHKFLKVAFPVDVRADAATYEIQFGCLRRPTHTNTSWDVAKYEVCGHRWADLSDPAHGVSLLNDSKYGHDIRRNVMRLSLLRAPKEPDSQADLGHHRFCYSLYPHAGGFIEAGTVRRGCEFNAPLRHSVVEPHAGTLPAACSFFAVDAPGVVLDTVKKAEDGDSIILRLYEAHGAPCRAKLTTALGVRSAVETDLLERKITGRPSPLRNGSLALEFTPFEVKTLRLTLRGGK